MSAKYILVVSYPGQDGPLVVLSNAKHGPYTCTEENLPSMRELGQRLVNERILDSAQIYQALDAPITRSHK